MGVVTAVAPSVEALLPLSRVLKSEVRMSMHTNPEFSQFTLSTVRMPCSPNRPPLPLFMKLNLDLMSIELSFYSAFVKTIPMIATWRFGNLIITLEMMPPSAPWSMNRPSPLLLRLLHCPEWTGKSRR